ncbi:MAG: FecR domain-containing protein, partial [Acidobacteria bacterium]|nr:FecR domain-containing protein [Acidobacteriota bacterium]
MDCNYLEKISLLVDDRLSPFETEEVKNHLAVCAQCRAAETNFLALRRQIKAIQIPRDRAAERKVLSEILRSGKSKPAGTTGKLFYLRPALAAALLIVVAFIGILIYNRPPQKSWDVARLEGTPRIAEKGINENGRLKIGEWLETDQSSRVQIAVADIGQVEVEPETRIRLVETRSAEHRLELERGSINARINAPPRLFFVNTPSATVIDYGCAYSLNVDEEGGSVLHVTEGWVSLALNGRESLVPASAYAKSRRGFGPGTPYFEDASGEFTDALTKFDFENGGATAIDVILAESRQRDALSLWYLLERATESDRARVFDRLTQLVSLPENATRAGVLALDRKMLDAWKETIDVTSVGESLTGWKPNAENFGALASAGNMTAPRAGHIATALPDGKVLIAGGMKKEADVLASAELFEPATGHFFTTGQMSAART